ncbi:MAG: hypothetical protein HY438_00430 [DPANN group archaeon]|nr:hypothetical protein [DPANN group archaeon]
MAFAHFIVVGDSIAYGAWDTEGGWVQRLRKFAEKKIKRYSDEINIVYNCGISGHTTAHWLEHFDAECAARGMDAEDSKVVIIISLGSNDASYLRNKKSNWVPKDEFAGNLKKLFCIAKRHASYILFVGLSPVDESKTNPVNWDKNFCCRNKDMAEYNKRAKSVCKQEKIPFINIYEQLKAGNKFISYDGVHLNSNGHKIIFEIVRDFLVKNKII